MEMGVYRHLWSMTTRLIVINFFNRDLRRQNLHLCEVLIRNNIVVPCEPQRTSPINRSPERDVSVPRRRDPVNWGWDERREANPAPGTPVSVPYAEWQQPLPWQQPHVPTTATPMSHHSNPSSHHSLLSMCSSHNIPPAITPPPPSMAVVGRGSTVPCITASTPTSLKDTTLTNHRHSMGVTDSMVVRDSSMGVTDNTLVRDSSMGVTDSTGVKGSMGVMDNTAVRVREGRGKRIKHQKQLARLGQVIHSTYHTTSK